MHGRRNALGNSDLKASWHLGAEFENSTVDDLYILQKVISIHRTALKPLRLTFLRVPRRLGLVEIPSLYYALQWGHDHLNDLFFPGVFILRPKNFGG